MTEITQNTAGSSAHNEPAYVLIGKLQKSHGIRGEIAMRVVTQFPERIRVGKSLYLGDDHNELVVNSLRWKNDLLLIGFAGFDNPEEVSKLTNLEVFSRIQDLPKLPKGQFYHHQLIGLKVWQGDEYLGLLTEIMETGANDVYVIKDDEAEELLIPAIPDVIKTIDLELGNMQVELLEGLRD